MTISDERQGLLFVLVGPGGGGKNALMGRVLERLDDIRQLPTATTRPKRPEEEQGVQHLFVSPDEFRRMIANDALIEYQEVHEGRFYGVPRETVERAIAERQDQIADIEVLGASILRTAYPDNVVLIFINVPGESEADILDVLRQRMEERGETEAEIQKRLSRTRMELPYAPTCDYLIINDEMDRAVEELLGVILAERSRRRLLNHRARLGLPRHKLAYVAHAIPVHHDEVLCRHGGEDRFPAIRLAHGEAPHEAALRAIDEQLDLESIPANLLSKSPSDASLIAPAAITTSDQPNAHRVIFLYLYRLDIRQQWEGWSWVPLEEADLPGELLDVLQPMDTSFDA